jgi:L-cysteine:1D-myo-inositol 2-amino-2-deoxy-alpha-D-glucopyranoside ligase
MEILENPWPSPTLPSVTATLRPLKLRGTNGEFEIPVGSHQRMYVCGITPYDATHLGHAATYLAFDLLNRYVLLGGGVVDFVENITDIDEPLLERAQRDNTDWQSLAQKETDLFASDMEALRILAPQWFVPATQTMDLVEVAITRMMERGFVYSLDGDLYFKTSSFLSELPYSLDESITIFSERGGDPEREGKEHPLDPVLWIANKKGEPGWPSPHGFGRPGWHIECAVISLRYLLGADFLHGDTSRGSLIDIQGGGRDLIFPHHFMSAIQVKAITGQQFSRGYIHTGMIGLNGEKMSKSKGNLVFVSKLLQAGIDPVVIRFALLREHYGADRMWSDEVLSRATIDVARIRDALARNEVAPTHDLITHIVDALSEDLDTPRVFELLFEWVLATESGIPGGSTGELSRALDSALGLAF